MEKNLSSFGFVRKLFVKSVEGREQSVSPVFSGSAGNRAIAFLLVDTSGSMYGEGIAQVKQGVLDFTRTALKKGYLTGLVKFDDYAILLCEPTAHLSAIQAKVEDLRANGGTRLAPALAIASQRLLGSRTHRVIVVATDGGTCDWVECLRTAETMKKDGIEILAIGTKDADWGFLSKLVSRKDLNLKVEGSEFGKAMDALARKLPTHFLEDKR